MQGKDKNFKLAMKQLNECMLLAVEINEAPSELAKLHWRIGQCKWHTQDMAGARSEFQTALNLVSGGTDNESKNTEFLAYIGLGHIARADTEYKEAIDYYNRAFEATRARQPDLKYPTIEELQVTKHNAMCMQSIGEIYELQNNISEAKTYYRASLKIRPNNPPLARKLAKL